MRNTNPVVNDEQFVLGKNFRCRRCGRRTQFGDVEKNSDLEDEELKVSSFLHRFLVVELNLIVELNEVLGFPIRDFGDDDTVANCVRERDNKSDGENQAKSRVLAAFCSEAVRMSTPARKRLMRDFKRLQQDPPAGISGAPQDNNIMLWNAVIFGPDDTPWDGGTFKLTLQFSEDYPNKPPTVRFVSRMFHPNIYADGSICLDILQNQWSPIYDVAAILTSIQSLLCDPNPNSPANSEAARMFSENKREYNRRVREIVEQSWTAD
ncbi:hypothetical protein Vadar_008057 [Vaccinium darrowii]|uniref:Uncharacterized protein n=1 Tax=Vaccinium darrowii TaxID=229202 RepID=A0ACB7WZ17_9ERIC|nr:hypothetical protein Vadar_008057 [Vaccinium darrowii]